MESRKFTEHHFITSDNVELYYKYWQAQKKSDKAIVLLHRGHEHSGRLQHIVDELNLPEVNMFAWDARGHGRSSGYVGIPSVDRSITDVEEFVRHIAHLYEIPIENMIVIAQSIGAVYAVAWVHDYAPRIRGLIIASPAFDVKLYVPFARQFIALGQKIIGQFHVQSYVKARFLTHDEKRIASYNNDPLITKSIASNLLLEMFKTSERIVADSAAIKTPLQLFISGNDFVVYQKAIYDFYNNVGSQEKEKYVLPGFFHDTLGEKKRAPVVAKMRQFICRKYAEPLFEYSYTNEDKTGFSAQKQHKLQQSEKCFYKRAYYDFLSWMLHHFGWLSNGMACGLKNGFDSGSSLDYVYYNKPSGKWLIGKWIDKCYLNSVGWCGVRIRKQLLVRQICKVIKENKAMGRPSRIVDVAAGYGGYLFEVLQKSTDVEKVLLRDFDADNVARGQSMIMQNKLEKIADFEQGDAFSAKSLAQIRIKPNIAVISGLFELFSDNTLICTTLSNLSAIMEKGGYLIYTNQPWHPQQELIARVLNSYKNGQPWIMRCRSQAEMDALVEQFGFKKICQECSKDAIFTVSIARKL